MFRDLMSMKFTKFIGKNLSQGLFFDKFASIKPET